VGFTRNTLQQFGVDGADRRSDALTHGDVYAGLHGAIAALAALQHRRLTGQGRYIDVAMAAVLTSMNERVHYDLSGTDLGAEQPILGATDCGFFTSPEGFDFVVPFSLVSSVTFRLYLAAMRRPDLADDPRFVTPELRKENLAALHAIVQSWIWTFESMDTLDAQFDEAKVATGRLRDITEFNETDWAKAWVTTREVDDRRNHDDSRAAVAFQRPRRSAHAADTGAPGRAQRSSSQGTRLHRRPAARAHTKRRAHRTGTRNSGRDGLVSPPIPSASPPLGRALFEI
jgi:crotonobetainyl-CoA:carnitine CoA-transferase CaiB-like acyl-CoA transferase